MTPETFLDAIEQFLRENSDWTASRFGKEAMNDLSFVFDLRNGRSPSIKNVERVLAFIESHSEERRGAA